jgi:hypothetical protein
MRYVYPWLLLYRAGGGVVYQYDVVSSERLVAVLLALATTFKSSYGSLSDEAEMY